MGQINFLFSFLIYTLLPLALTGVFVWSFLDAVFRPADQFALASQSKNFWLILLGGGGLAYFAIHVLHVYFPMSGFVSLALLIGAVYYLGPERAKMGPRWRGNGGRRGSW
ncbi:DUF2516 family protein [Trueperella pyogenes]|uniref:DUF2516 family protein n=1 Tax=Trueperella pyogenes TaxID=1661 RepID=UPI00043AD763|nr:DUF2516 family protein [Trueperella pyogenes]AHU90065.1 hypothetical protein CQ11_09010 [Trueperella pyogenes]AZR02823.1 DUF2516 family protein [Trueperella pyogenes]MDF2420991.1 DUF2516 family protein [Trueperella pyogenes]OQD33081.1 hypothetical protein B1R42_09295 [Trueperella pyogenes]UVJ60037.1 DUF2516 family protein [Trueperella pyogenes]